MEFSLGNVQQAVLFCPEGAVVMDIPHPARYALHKLLVYGECSGAFAAKSNKDIVQSGFRAANAGQFMVDLIIAPRPMHATVPVTFSEDDLVASEVPGLQWLLNAPKLDVVAVDEDGWPVPFRVPDPRAFALHKAWQWRRGGLHCLNIGFCVSPMSKT